MLNCGLFSIALVIPTVPMTADLIHLCCPNDVRDIPPQRIGDLRRYRCHHH